MRKIQEPVRNTVTRSIAEINPENDRGPSVGDQQETAEAETSQRRDRSALGYLEPKGTTVGFAQCGTCGLFIRPRPRCYVLSDQLMVDEDDSCTQYFLGDPIDEPELEPMNAATPQEVGFIRDTNTRCENCVSFADDFSCRLFQELNAKLPGLFNLDVGVRPKACCNAFQPQ